ncbi:hypothetical protein D3C86_1775820 [compost metagenome]
MLLPTTFVAVLPMSKNWSMPMISNSPASGIWNIERVAATTTNDALATPAMPLLVTIKTSSMVNCCVIESSILYAWAINITANA